jgi:hypothetical protein
MTGVAIVSEGVGTAGRKGDADIGGAAIDRPKELAI